MIPSLPELIAMIPQPIVDFFGFLQNFNFGENSDAISRSLGAGKPVSGFLDAVWTIFLTLIKGVGSVFVWILRTFADFLEGLIFGRV